MEAIRDLSWMAQVALGTLERFELNGWAVTAVGTSHGGTEAGKAVRNSAAYRFRLLFSEPGDRRPVYAINLENSILGEWVISEQEGSIHRIVERLGAPLPYDQFRIHALERAIVHLGDISTAKNVTKKTKESRQTNR